MCGKDCTLSLVQLFGWISFCTGNSQHADRNIQVLLFWWFCCTVFKSSYSHLRGNDLSIPACDTFVYISSCCCSQTCTLYSGLLNFSLVFALRFVCFFFWYSNSLHWHEFWLCHQQCALPCSDFMARSLSVFILKILLQWCLRNTTDNLLPSHYFQFSVHFLRQLTRNYTNLYY